MVCPKRHVYWPTFQITQLQSLGAKSHLFEATALKKYGTFLSKTSRILHPVADFGWERERESKRIVNCPVCTNICFMRLQSNDFQQTVSVLQFSQELGMLKFVSRGKLVPILLDRCCDSSTLSAIHRNFATQHFKILFFYFFSSKI